MYKLANLSEYAETDFIKALSFSKNKEMFLEITKELIMKIKQFAPGSKVNSMVRNICRVVLEHMDNQVSIKFIADKLGYKDVEYFSKVLKKYTEITPSEFKANCMIK